MSENTQNNTPKKEQYSLNDDRRVKVLSPGALVAKRFFRNRLAVVGLSILVAMFLFSFVGGLVSPYGQDEQFFTYTQMSKEYVGVTRNDKLRFVVADGQEFGSIAQSKGNEAIKKGEETFTYKDNDYEVETLSEDLYVFRQGRTVLAYAAKDMVTAADGVAELSFDAKLAALTAQAAGETTFTADGQDYALDDDGNITQSGSEVAYIGRFVVSAADASVVISRDFRDRLEEAIDDNITEFTYTDADGNFTGFDTELATAVCEKLGVEPEFVEINWDTKVVELDAKSIDCIWNGMTLTDDIMANAATTKAYAKNAQVVVVKDDTDYSSTADLVGKTVVAEAGSAGEAAIEGDENLAQADYVSKSVQTDCLMEVAAGTADAAVIDSLMAGAMVGEGTGYDSLTYTVSLNAEEGEQYGVGFRQGSDLAQALSDFFAASYADGSMVECAETYGIQAALIAQ